MPAFTTTRLHAAAVLIALAGVACSATASRPATGLGREQSYELGRSVVEYVVDDSTRLAGSAKGTRVLFVTAQACLTCRDVGFLVRRLAQRSTSTDTRLLLVTPAQDSAAVTAFLRQERASVPLILVPESVAPGLMRQSVIYYGRVDGNSLLADSAIANDASALLALVKD